MKVTSDGIEHTIETPRYHYLECVGETLFPKSVSFKGVFIGESHIQGLRFVDWLGMMLNNKIVIASENTISPLCDDLFRKVSPIKDPYLTVSDTSHEYLTSTIYNILTILLADGDSQIKSLEWIS